MSFVKKLEQVLIKFRVDKMACDRLELKLVELFTRGTVCSRKLRCLGWTEVQ